MNIERQWKATAAGVMSIIAGSMHLVGWLAVALIFSRLLGSGSFGDDETFISGTTIWMVVLPILILAIIAIIGGIFALNKKSWRFALVGAVCAICSPASWIIGVAATVLLSISKDEFNRSNG